MHGCSGRTEAMGFEVRIEVNGCEEDSDRRRSHRSSRVHGDAQDSSTAKKIQAEKRA